MGTTVSVQPIPISGREAAAERAPAGMGIMGRLAVAAINGYQRSISPHKGFRCAHRVLHGEESCSQYVKRIVDQEGLGRALQLAPARFTACRAASRVLRADAEDGPYVPWYRRGATGKGGGGGGDASDCETAGCCVEGASDCLPCG